MVDRGMRGETTTIRVDPSVRDELKKIKPYDSMSYNDLLRDMAKQYDPEVTVEH